MSHFGRYRKEINPNFAFSVLAGTGLNDRTETRIGVNSAGFINPLAPPNLNNGSSTIPSSYNEQRRIAGLYSTLGFEIGNQLYSLNHLFIFFDIDDRSRSNVNGYNI